MVSGRRHWEYIAGFSLALLGSARICLTRICLPRTPSAKKKKPLQPFTDFSVG